MIGAFLGDMIGAPYEFDRGEKTKEFPLFSEMSHFTDDSVMTLAVADALLQAGPDADGDTVRKMVTDSMRRWGAKYPDAGYGGGFYRWLFSRDPKPYGSYGNGSAMRVSPAGWLYETIERTREAARWTAEVTHNHPEGIKGAEATASAIFLGRNEISKEKIRDYIVQEFGYDLSRTCEEIRRNNRHDESCQKTVPEAMTAFFEGNDFEDVIRNAVSFGGDTDTLACIAGSIAEAFYGVPDDLELECRKRLPEEWSSDIDRFLQLRLQDDSFYDPFLAGNEIIEQAISRYYSDATEDTFITVMEIIRLRMHEDGHFILPIRNEEDGSFLIHHLDTKDGKAWMCAFTSQKEFAKGERTEILSDFIDQALEIAAENEEGAGIVLNPWGQSFTIPREMIQMFLEADKQTMKGAVKNEDNHSDGKGYQDTSL